jgi:hypothetical protein
MIIAVISFNRYFVISFLVAIIIGCLGIFFRVSQLTGSIYSVHFEDVNAAYYFLLFVSGTYIFIIKAFGRKFIENNWQDTGRLVSDTSITGF